MGFPKMYEVEAIYYPILALVGVPVNILAIVILSRGRCGLSKVVTLYLVAMVAADLMVIINDVILNRINNMYFRFIFLYFTPVCKLVIVLLASSTRCSIWLTVAFTVDRYVAICCQQIKNRYCSAKTARLVITTVCVLSCAQCIPLHIILVPIAIVTNIPMYCYAKPIYYTSPYWRAYLWLIRVLSPVLVSILTILFNVLTVRHVLVASRARERIRGDRRGNKQEDPEMEKRRKYIVLLFAISGSFVVLWMTNVVYSLKWSVANYHYQQKLDNSRFIIQQTGFMLQLLSSCTNTCIYTVTQSKFREEMKKILKYPFALCVPWLK